MRAIGFLLVITLLAVLPSALSQTFMVKNYDLLGGDFVNRGDFNHDGILDLVSPTFQNVVIDANGDTVGVASIGVSLGKGDGTFQAPIRSPAPDGASEAAIGDFNHDGNLDLATINFQLRVTILLGNGDGSFASPRFLPITTALEPTSIAAGDFNGDGNLDIAVGSGNPAQPGENLGGVVTEPNTITIFPGDGHGNFGTPVNFSGFGTTPIRQIRVADFNADGKQDIGVATENEAIALIGEGQFGFTPNLLSTYFSVGGITPTDVNQDGATDLLVSFVGCNGTCSAIDVFESTGPNHGLERFTTIQVASTTTVTASGAVGSSVAQNSEAQTTSTARVFSGFTPIPPFRPTAVDINGDGINDIVANLHATGLGFDSVNVWLGKPDGTFEGQPHQWILESEGLFELVPGDFNRDGKIDIATTNVSRSTLTVLLNSTPKAPCNVSTQFSTVTICTPQDLAFSNSPVPVVAVSTAEEPVVGNPIVAGQIYVDNVLAQSFNSTQIDASLPMPVGDHFVVAKFFDSAGGSNQAVSHISVFNGGPGETCPTSPQTLSICAPAANGPFSSPLHVLASVMANAPVTAFQVYIDDNLVNNDEQHDTYIDTAFPLSPGPHKVVVQAFDALGVVYKAARDVVIE